MHVNMIASSIKIIDGHNGLIVYRFKSAMVVSCVLGLLFANTAAIYVQLLSSTWNDRLLDRFHHVLICSTAQR